jgi:hypothetical protein
MLDGAFIVVDVDMHEYPTSYVKELLLMIFPRSKYKIMG